MRVLWLPNFLLRLFKRLKERVNGLKLGCKKCPTLSASVSLSFKTGLVISEPRPSSAWRARDIAWDRLACDHRAIGHTPVLKSIPKSDVLVKKVVRRNIAPAKRNGPGG